MAEPTSRNGASRRRSSRPPRWRRASVRPSFASWTAPRGSSRPSPATTPPTASFRAGPSTTRRISPAPSSSTSRGRFPTRTRASSSWRRRPSASPTPWACSASATTPASCSIPPAASCGRPGSGGCCVRSASTVPRCSTAAGRSGRRRGAPSPPNPAGIRRRASPPRSSRTSSWTVSTCSRGSAMPTPSR